MVKGPKSRGIATLVVLSVLACESGTDPQVGDLRVSDLKLPTALRNTPYDASLASAVSGGRADYSWRLSGGSLPAGLTLTPSGIVNGTPTENGTFFFDAAVTSGSQGPETARFEVSVIDPLSLATSMERTSAGFRENEWRCEFTWTVTAVGGRPTDRAYWLGGEVQWYRADGARSVSQLSQPDFMDWFGEDQINFGQVLSIPFYLAWDGPFEATVSVHYSTTPTFARTTAISRINCM
jgi:hypothetical protein